MNENGVDSVKNGSEDAFAELLEQYSPLISSLVDETGKNYGVDEKEDLRQEACIALFRAALAYKPNEKVTFGLYAKICIKNRLISYCRHISNKDMFVLCPPEEGEDVEDDPSQRPDNALIDAESLDILKKKIRACLTDFEYSVFIRYAEGMERKDIARSLSVTETSVSNSLYRVKTKLKKILGACL